jgi:hypothetical protein
MVREPEQHRREPGPEPDDGKDRCDGAVDRPEPGRGILTTDG